MLDEKGIKGKTVTVSINALKKIGNYVGRLWCFPPQQQNNAHPMPLGGLPLASSVARVGGTPAPSRKDNKSDNLPVFRLQDRHW
eukprot:1984210-Amphidinium_carterae.1